MYPSVTGLLEVGQNYRYIFRGRAEVAELADALDSKSSGPKGRVGSTPTFGTSFPVRLCLPDATVVPPNGGINSIGRFTPMKSGRAPMLSG